MKQRSLTKQTLSEIALKFNSKGEFQRGDKSAYLSALRKGLLPEICSHMETKRRNLTRDELLKISEKYTSRIEFKSHDISAYRAAIELGCLDDVCSHMKRQRRILTKEVVLKIAKRFDTISAFQRGDGSSYNFARKEGFLEEACRHMQAGGSAFNQKAKAFLYQIKLILSDGTILWKVGITNRGVKWRIRNMGIPQNIQYEVTHTIEYKIGSDAKSEEVRLHQIGRSNGAAYSGVALLRNGNTELFYEPLIPC